MAFVKKNYLLLIWIAGLVVCSVMHISFLYTFLGSLAYLILILLLRFKKSVYYLGYIVQGIGKNPELAFKMYSYAYDKGGRTGAPMIAYGMLLLSKSQYDKALTVFQDVLMIENLNPNFLKVARQDLAIAYEKTGDVQTAIDTMELMLQDYEFFSNDFFANLGFFYIEAKEYDKAREITERALKDDEGFGPAYDNLGLIAYETGDLEEAEELFKKALDLRDTMVSSKYYLGLIAEKNGDIDTAATYFAAAHAGKITGMHTITREMVDEKYQQYCL